MWNIDCFSWVQQAPLFSDWKTGSYTWIFIILAQKMWVIVFFEPHMQHFTCSVWLFFLEPWAPQLLELSKKNILICSIPTFIQLWDKLFLYVRISTYWFKKKQAYWSKGKIHCTCWSIFTLQDKTSWYSLQGINIYILLDVCVIKSGNWARFPSNSINSLNDYFSSQILVSKGKKELENQKKE